MSLRVVAQRSVITCMKDICIILIASLVCETDKILTPLSIFDRLLTRKNCLVPIRFASSGYLSSSPRCVFNFGSGSGYFYRVDLVLMVEIPDTRYTIISGVPVEIRAWLHVSITLLCCLRDNCDYRVPGVYVRGRSAFLR